MGGLVIDIYVAFILKGIVRIFWMVRTMSWRRLQATILSSSRESDWCPIVEVSYKFSGKADFEIGETTIPFLFTQTADRCAKALSAGRTITIRIAQDDSCQTIFFLRDNL